MTTKNHTRGPGNNGSHRRLWLLAATGAILLLMVPLASADMGASTRTYTDGAFTSWGSQFNVASNVQTSFNSLGVTIALTPADVTVTIKQNCAGGAVVYAYMQGSGLSETLTWVTLGGDCFWVNRSGTSAGANRYYTIATIKENFEGQLHANTTRLEMNVTRTTQNDIQNVTRTTQNDIQNQTRTDQNHAQNVTRTEQNDIQNSSSSGGGCPACVTNAWANSSEGFCRKGTGPDNGCVGNRYANGTAFCYNGSDCNVTAMSMHGLPPTSFTIPVVLIVLALAGVAVGFVSKTNPLAPFAGMVAEVVGGILTTANQSSLGTNTKVYVLLFAVCFLVLAAKAFFILRPEKDELDFA